MSVKRRRASPTTMPALQRSIRRWASSDGTHVTSIAIEGAIHDVVLSRPAVRAEAYDAIGTWLDAWVEKASERATGVGS